ncbi:transporter substrate-binding domain-containing protein [Arcobacteraceae bacterium]|nr:transporter substrate-binding domain-containing protein [Arcobacteraceae bacterium]
MKFIVITLFLLLTISSASTQLRVGVLAFGTVNWELNIIKLNNLASKYNVDIDIKKFPSKNAVSVALNAGAVDMIVSDFVWVSRQRSNGFDYTFYPYSKATGGVYVNPQSNIINLTDLENKKLGIAGGPVSKTWLIARAYSKSKYNVDLKTHTKPVFAAPPILNHKLLDNSVDATINFWHFNAKLEAKGMKKLISIEEMLLELGIKHDIPLIGWVFSKKFANSNKELINGFLNASYDAKKLLSTDDLQWNKIKKLMKVKDERTFESLKNGYIKGIPKEFGNNEINAAKNIFKILAKEGGAKLVGKNKNFQEGTFWEFKPNITW